MAMRLIDEDGDVVVVAYLIENPRITPFSRWGDCSLCGGSNMMGARFCNWCGIKLWEDDDNADD